MHVNLHIFLFDPSMTLNNNFLKEDEIFKRISMEFILIFFQILVLGPIKVLQMLQTGRKFTFVQGEDSQFVQPQTHCLSW